MTENLHYSERVYYIWNTEEPFLGKCFESPPLTLHNCRFHIKFSAERCNDKKKWVLCTIHRSEPYYKTWKVRTYVKGRSGRFVLLDYSTTVSGKFDTSQQAYRTSIWESLKFEQEEDFKYTENGSITFIFFFDDVIETTADIENKRLLGEKVRETCCSKDFSNDMEKLLMNEQYSDIKLQCENVIFPAHRNILATRSEVFARMFENETSKTKTKLIVMKEVSPNTVGIFLKFLYTGKLNLWSTRTALELYSIAHSYGVRNLRHDCSSYMAENLTESCVCDIIVSANEVKDMMLLDEATKFACKMEGFLSSFNWTELAKGHSELALKVLNKILEYSYNKRKTNSTAATMFRKIVR